MNAKLFWNVIRACEFWKCALNPYAWVNLRSQCADPVRDRDSCNAACEPRSSNHEPNQGVNCDLKRLSELDFFLCEQAHRSMLDLICSCGACI